MRTLFAILAVVLTSQLTLAEDAKQILLKIQIAKDTYYADREKAEQKLLELLARRENAAKSAGDLKNLEKAREEIQAFRQEGKLPTIVPVRDYENGLKLAMTKLENAYAAGIKSLTQADLINDAKELQQQLVTLKNPEVKKSPEVKIPTEEKEKVAVVTQPLEALPGSNETGEPIQAGSVWMNEKKNHLITFDEIKDERFKGKYTFYHSADRPDTKSISGPFKNGQFSWLGKESFGVKGNNSRYNGECTIAKDEKGYRIDFVKSNGSDRETVILRLKK